MGASRRFFCSLKVFIDLELQSHASWGFHSVDWAGQPVCFVTWKWGSLLKYFVFRSMSSVSVYPILVSSSILNLIKWLFILIIKIGGITKKQGIRSKRLFSKTIDLWLSIDMQMYRSLWKGKQALKHSMYFQKEKDLSFLVHIYESWLFMEVLLCILLRWFLSWHSYRDRIKRGQYQLSLLSSLNTFKHKYLCAPPGIGWVRSRLSRPARDDLPQCKMRDSQYVIAVCNCIIAELQYLSVNYHNN